MDILSYDLECMIYKQKHLFEFSDVIDEINLGRFLPGYEEILRIDLNELDYRDKFQKKLNTYSRHAMGEFMSILMKSPMFRNAPMGFNMSIIDIIQIYMLNLQTLAIEITVEHIHGLKTMRGGVSNHNKYYDLS